MNTKLKLSLLAIVTALSSACTRIETGEVGLRVNFFKEVKLQELQPGSLNQTLVGDVLTFPVRDIALVIDNKTPLTADDSALQDFDYTVVYSINPAMVAELYTTKSKGFHAQWDKDNDVYLMYNYIRTVADAAAYKAVRKHKSLTVGDNRAQIEQDIASFMTASLKDEKLETAITINKVQVRNALPNTAILAQATAYVASQNELRVKDTEVQIAKKEAERMAALANQSTQSIQYMQAQAMLNISEGIKAGKVQTIIVPSNFTGLMTGTK